MSTNRKNRNKPVLRNMVKSQDIPRRNIITLEAKLDNAVLREIVDDVNDAIGQINCLVATRNIPYIRIDETIEYHDLDKARVLLRSEKSDSRALCEIKDEFRESLGNTFLVELYLNDNGYIEIGCSEDNNLETIGLSNLVLCDREFLPCVLVDIFLDSAIFNSYSFLRNLPVSEKRSFNQIKVDFLRSVFDDFTEFQSPFYSFNNKRYKYLSMAFFARKTDESIDYSELISLWDKFVMNYYANFKHEEIPVGDQLKSLVDYNQYSKEIISQFLTLKPGTYWLLRVHRAPVNEHVRKWLNAIFGKAEIGAEKIIRFEEFDTVYDLIREQNITAFKIIVPE